MFQSLLNLFFPKSCAGCNSFLLKNEYVICTECRHEIPLTNHYKIKNNEAYSKFYGRIPIEFASAFFYFHKKGIVQEMIHKLKYKGHQEIGSAIGYWYAEELKKCIEISNVDFIIPVPLHEKRLKERGYNQVTTFGESLSQTLNVKYNDSILIRNVYSKTQTTKSILGRSTVIESVFGVKFDENHHNKNFLLIDDVITTGSTLEACSRELLKIPGAKISIVCMAMTQ
ncbi:ComF family protein [Flavobacterium aquatile]|uniref:Amidophosphoribosyltransferase n=1 Tax=Flavobacterium aquatile LMG 4008 = ATCC 11947 TaxID=1453498 RepID=A0A095UX85_9FLAO|nr:ComF family protein [Flavobacterium aquatile]KGD67160.1 amidophosphoribosyltransferase [Flavobacterium aquatile LMG 4008 = ATCC 11947]OXA66682.1 amidophosphoribosyltransferase [Flavobacterium aquatile LMG 4008 = ATCC 11947]GEC78456.1 amidophosphoribosyltransferase [Flavobacterium aquatile]